MHKELLQDWLKFAEDVVSSCAATEEWLMSLRLRTEAAIAADESADEQPYFGTCDVEDCRQESVNNGGCWRETGYWKCCSKHAAQFRAGERQPIMKPSAVIRECRRRPDGTLPD